MYALKSIVRRGSALSMTIAFVAATIISSIPMPVSADALNPLTDRSLTLSSGSPGWDFLDASGNATYAPPNSGANGQKTGNTFDFKVSSTATVKGISFQYCTTSAGECYGPGDNGCETGTKGGGDCARKTNAQALAAGDNTSDLEIVVDGNQDEATFATYVTDANAATNPNGMVASIPAASSTGSNFMVYYLEGTTWTASTGWSMAATNNQDGTEGDGEDTDKNNYIQLTNSSGLALDAGERVKVVFFGTDSNYITNPGSNEFFVKINTWNTETTANWTPGDMTYNIDGGVTVANVMNFSIEIQTKVLETMDFSVGTVDPFTLEATQTQDGTSELFLATGRERHIPCERILTGMTPNDPVNILQMGNEAAEDSLETDVTYITHSYWRLSSNSSAGATVYYSGDTLSNTVDDQIDAIGATAAAPAKGSEQFGLALANGTSGSYAVDYDVERFTGFLYENSADKTTNGIHASVKDDNISNLDENGSYHDPQLYPLIPTTNYSNGAGTVNPDYDDGGGTSAVNTSFAFDPTSLQIPVAIATENDQVVDCVTGKMRYIANIAATTPAGIYTTNINYIAAPQY